MREKLIIFIFFSTIFISCTTLEQKDYILIANIYERGGKYDYAINEYTQGIKEYPDSQQLYYARGKTYYITHQYQKAADDFTMAILFGSEMLTDCYGFRGSAYFNLERYDEALTDFNTAISMNDKISELYNARGLVYDELKNYKEALNDNSRAILLDGGNSLYYYNRSLLYLEIGDNYNAFSDINKAIELNSDDHDYYSHRAYVLLKLAETEENDSVKLHYLEMGKENIEKAKKLKVNP